MNVENYSYKYEPLVPYMPENPIPGKSYTPYQIDPKYFDVNEAYKYGTLYPALASPYPGKTIGKEVY